MNWLQKLSQLERDWWRNAQHHMTKVLEMKFNPLPPKTWPHGDHEIVYQGNSYTNTPPVGVESYEFELDLRFRLYRKLKMYECFASLTFDRKMEAFITYDRKSPSIYRTDRVRGLENIDANLMSVSCYVKSRHIGEQIENQKILGPIELSKEEFTPYNILETIESLILSDFDDNNEDEINAPDPVITSYDDTPYGVEPEETEDEGVLVPVRLRDKPGTWPPSIGASSLSWLHKISQQEISPMLAGLAAEAKKCPTFEDFRNAFAGQIKHGMYWHVTNDPNFFIDPEKGPRDMSSMALNKMDPGHLMITSHLDYWATSYAPDRKYAAMIDMSAVDPKEYQQVSRGMGNEFFVHDPTRARVIGVFTIKDALRIDTEHHESLPQNDEELAEFYEMAKQRHMEHMSPEELMSHQHHLPHEDWEKQWQENWAEEFLE